MRLNYVALILKLLVRSNTLIPLSLLSNLNTEKDISLIIEKQWIHRKIITRFMRVFFHVGASDTIAYQVVLGLLMIDTYQWVYVSEKLI